MADNAYTWQFDAKGTSEATGLFQIISKLDDIVQRLTKHEASNRSELLKSSAAMKREGDETDKATKKKTSLFHALTKAAGVWNTWNKAVDFAAKRLRQLYDGFTALFSKVQEIGGGFERSAATMQVLAKSAGGTSEEIKTLVDTTKLLGRTTDFTAQQATSGATTLLKAGETTSGAYNKLGVALKAALATGLDIDKVAAIGNHAFKIFGDNLGKVGGRAADYDTSMRVMIASANAADVTVSQLDASLTKGGAILARLGIPLTRVNAALGLMANKGFTGSTAMRQLSIGVKRLVDGTIPAQAALNELGIKTVDSSGNFRDLGQVMQEIGDALDLRPMNEQTKLMKNLFGAADKSMGALLSGGVKGFNELENAILRNIDVMDELEKERGKGMVGSYKQFQSAVEGVYIELTSVLSVPISQFWQSLANILNIVSDRIIKVATDFQEGKGTLEEWVDAIKNGSFEGMFDGLPQELQPQIDTLKTLFKGLVDIVIDLFKSGLANAAADIWNAIFTDDIKSKAGELGKEVGGSLLKGILSTDIGKIIGGTIATNMMFSVLGAVNNIQGVLKTAGLIGKAAPAAASAAPAAAGVAGAGIAVAAGVGLAIGAVEYAAIKAAEGHYNKKAQRADEEGLQTLESHLEKMLTMKDKISKIPLIDRTDKDEKKLQNINREIMQTGDQLRQARGGTVGEIAGAEADIARSDLEKTDAAINARVEAQMKKAEAANAPTPGEVPDYLKDWKPKMSLDEGGGKTEKLSPKDLELQRYVEDTKEFNKQKGKVKTLGYSASEGRIEKIAEGYQQKFQSLTSEQGYSEEEAAAETLLQLKQDVLGKQDELISAEKRQKEAIEESNAVLMKTTVEINNAGSAFDQWLLNPINIFQQKLMGIKEGFAGVVDSLRSKKIDLEEKFGLKNADEANTARVENLKKSLEKEQDLLKLAQSPEEQQKIQERMAGKTEQLAGLVQGDDQTKYAQQAADYLAQAEESAMKGEELRTKQLEVEQENARKNLEEYEKLVQNSQTSGSRAGYLEQLKDAYMALGPEYQDKAVQAQEDWKNARTEAAAEQAENFKRMAENSQIQVELLQRAVDALESAAQMTQEQMQIPPDSAGYADAA